MNTEQHIALLQKQLDELKASLAKKDDGLWYPEPGDNYWYIDSDREILVTSRNYDDDPCDVGRFKFHNVFQTKEQAERHAKRLKLYNKHWKLAEHLNGDWVPDWADITVSKYAIKSSEDEFKVDSFNHSNLGNPTFKSKELAGKAISMLTDEEKEIFKNIYRP